MSLDGLGALIALEGARLEGAQKTSQNSFQVGSQVHGQGLQKAEQLQNKKIQAINAEYELGCAAATVKRLECKYAREMEIASRNLAIAQVVMVGSLLSNAWDAVGDLLGGKENLGDKPEWMQTKPIDPKDSNTVVCFANNDGPGERTVMVAGVDSDNMNVVNSFTRRETATQVKITGDVLDKLEASGFKPDRKMLNDKGLMDKTFTKDKLVEKMTEINPGMDKRQITDLVSVMLKGGSNGPEASNFRTAKFSNEEMREIGGAEYQKMKAENGGNDLTFKEIQAKNPDLATKILEQVNSPAGLSRDMGNGEVRGFLNLVEGLKDKGATASVRYSNGTVGQEPVIRSNTIDEIKSSLIDTGKMTKHDAKGFVGRVGDNLLDGAHSITGVLVQSAQESMPYFQAYLDARSKAENTWKNNTNSGELDLVGAYAKLNAANKKLNQINVDIGLFDASEGKSI